jgi:ABC-type lipoprotein release transport system permease subunit
VGVGRGILFAPRMRVHTYHLHGRGGGGGWLLQIYVRFLVIAVIAVIAVVIAVIAVIAVVRNGSGGSWPAVVGVFGDFKLQHPHRHPRQFYLLHRRTEQTHPGIQRMASFGQTEVPGGQGFGRQASGVRPGAVFRTVD